MPTPPRTPGDGIQAIAMRCVDAKATYYGTFQSPNQKVIHDHAVSRSPIAEPYAIGGCRELTSEGDVIGSFTDRGVDPAHVYFIRIPGARRRDG